MVVLVTGRAPSTASATRPRAGSPPAATRSTRRCATPRAPPTWPPAPARAGSSCARSTCSTGPRWRRCSRRSSPRRAASTRSSTTPARPIGGVEQVDVELARTGSDTNVWGTMALVQEALPLLRAQGGGHLVLVSSCFVAGLPGVGMGWYLAAKAALEALFLSLAAEADPARVRTTVLAAGPGVPGSSACGAIVVRAGRRPAARAGGRARPTAGSAPPGPRPSSRTRPPPRSPRSSPRTTRRRPSTSGDASRAYAAAALARPDAGRGAAGAAGRPQPGAASRGTLTSPRRTRRAGGRGTRRRPRGSASQ